MKLLKFIAFYGHSLSREIRKRKFKALFRYFSDSRYRRDINFLADTLSIGPFKQMTRPMALHQIRFSHDINYQDWVDVLIEQIEGYDGMWMPPPMMVIYNRIKDDGSYLVVDGNHRLAALKQTRSPGFTVEVIELYK